MEDLKKTGLASLDGSVLFHPLKVETVVQEDKCEKMKDKKPPEIKQEPVDEHPVGMGIKSEDITDPLRAKLSNLKIEIEPRYAYGDTIHSAGSLSDSEPQTPACKGVGYTIEWGFVSMFFGPCQYFTAPTRRHQDFSEYAVFSLSASRKTVSHVDDNLTHCWYPVSDYHGDAVVRFEIGGLTYQWNTQINSLAFEPLEPQPSAFAVALQLSIVQLFGDVNAAKAMAKQRQEESRHLRVVTPNVIPTGQGRPHQSLSDEGYSSRRSSSDGSSIGSGVLLSPSSPSVEVIISPREMTPPEGLNGCFSGASSKQEIKSAIDRWVDQTAAARRTNHETGNIKCPETGCGASSRRPHALKTHLYSHYGIRPIECGVCSLRVLTDANLARHVRNAHTCPGCPSAAPILDMKTHKLTCSRAAKAAAANKRKKDRARAPAGMSSQPDEGFYGRQTHH